MDNSDKTKLALLTGAGILAAASAFALPADAKAQQAQPATPAITCSDDQFTVDCLVQILDQALPTNAAQRSEVELRQDRWLRGAKALWANENLRAQLHASSVLRELTDIVTNTSIHPIIQGDALDFMSAIAAYEVQQNSGTVPASSNYQNLNTPETRTALVAYVNSSRPAALRYRALDIAGKVAASQPDVSNLLVDRALQSTSADEREVIMEYLTLDNATAVGTLFTKIREPGQNGAAGDTIQVGAIRTLGEMYSAKVADVNAHNADQQARDTALQPYASTKARLQAECIGTLYNSAEAQAVRDQAAQTLVGIASGDQTVQAALAATGYANLLSQ
ncbi:MAG: hypothetical protein KJ574_03215 [Nanoarchaeota archaeon]|nr:hypothetical protein [Nanoarchaeota archaeon]